jgi:hypothetical protein
MLTCHFLQSLISPIMTIIELRALNVEERILGLCAVGDEAIAWTRSDLDFICFYAERTCGGDGRIIKLPKVQIPGLAIHLDMATAEISAIEGTTCVIRIVIEVDEREFFAAQDAGWPPPAPPF